MLQLHRCNSIQIELGYFIVLFEPAIKYYKFYYENASEREIITKPCCCAKFARAE